MGSCLERARMSEAVLLFAGQGAQRVGMGKDLVEEYPAAADEPVYVLKEIDSAATERLSPVIGKPLLVHQACGHRHDVASAAGVW